MARRGARVDFRQLKRLQKNIQKLDKAGLSTFSEEAVKELAARMLRKVIKRTPVGVYTDGTTGGTLRRGWTIGEVKKIGNLFEVEVINPVEYSQYVEFGHRTANHQGWVNGRFMMTISADQVEQAAPAILEKKLMRLLKGAFDGN